MAGGFDGGVAEQMDRRGNDGWMDRWMDGWMDGQMCGWTDVWIGRLMNVRVAERIHDKHGPVDGQLVS